MKTTLNFFCLLMCCVISMTALAQTRSISQEEALLVAKQEFEGKDVDYFVLRDRFSNYWTIFVDAEPMKGWEHECYLLSIPRTLRLSTTDNVPITKTLLKLPPAGDFIPLSVKNRYDTNTDSKPLVAKTTHSNNAITSAQRTYAIILSGGVNKISNHERYWNDCSFIYQTLVNKYGIPKENIFPIMSDGNNPAEDMRCITGGFISQPLDLDGDGTDDIKLAATKANIQSTLNTLKIKIQEDDHLFFYVIDHGGATPNYTNSYINLWNDEVLYDYELASMLNPFTQKHVNVNVVLGQCFSGGFIDDLTKAGCVVASASTEREPSWACSDIPYDEFVYQWTTAINGANHRGVKVKSDTDNNGRITMEEAFIYAKDHDRRKEEHPQYVSTPLSVGEDLAFNYLAPAVDLYIKDSYDDTGKEPNMTTNEFWKSPFIWVRNYEDSIFSHQNPEYSSDHQMAFVYARVHNRGKKKFDGKGKWVIIYWSQASTGISTKTWKGRETYDDKYATGGILEAIPIPEIESDKYVDVSVGWTLPKLLKNYPEGNFHFCLLAKIMDTPYDDGYKDGVTYFDLKGSNDQAQKNVTIIRKNDVNKEFNVYVRNIDSSAKAYTLELKPSTVFDEKLYSIANVEMEMSPKIYSAWERGGFISQDIEAPETNVNGTALRKVKFISPKSKLQNISLKGTEFDVVKLKFNFTNYSNKSYTYYFDLIQKNENGDIIGGESFVVESPTLMIRPMNIMKTPIGDAQFKLEIEDTGFELIKWENSLGETISNNEYVIVTPTASDHIYSVTAMTEDGDVVVDNISLNKENGIASVLITETGNMKICLSTSAPVDSKIYITSLTDGTIKASHYVSEGSKDVCLEIGDLAKGMYIVSYYINSDIIDQVKVKID